MLLSVGEAPSRLRALRSEPRALLTLPLSIGAHVVVLYVVVQTPWGEIDPPDRSPLRVAWLTMPQPKERPLPPAAESEPATRVEPAAADAAVESPAAESSAETPTPQPAVEPTPVPAESAPPEQPARRRLDLDQARRDAIAATLEAREREASLGTFSAADHIVIEEPEEPSPRAEMFDSPTPSRAFGKPGQQRTKVGRALVKACSAVTGGFSVNLFGFTFGGISFCADPGGDGGLFADIEPDYLRYEPKCIDAGVGPEDGLPPGPLRDPATVKCRIGPPVE
jgi:hypothetical protein